jgi:hypothetical protein
MDPLNLGRVLTELELQLDYLVRLHENVNKYLQKVSDPRIHKHLKESCKRNKDAQYALAGLLVALRSISGEMH